MMTADRWSPAAGLLLEPNARQAVMETQTSVAITAGPGAGKTEVLAQRADFLLRTGACRYPSRILAISFKVDASHNLKSRVRQRCGSELAARLDSHTFHAFAKRIIDRFRPVLTGQDALDPDYVVGERRIQGKSITFKDFVPLALKIVETSPVVRKAIRHTYSHVFLDEFQDCTDDQYELVAACFLGTPTLLTAVGDTKQSIMGWAGALDGVFNTYAQDFAATSLHLYQNFRSAPQLRRMQNAMVRVMDPPAALNDDEIVGDGGDIEVWRICDDDVEAMELAKAIGYLIEQQGLPPSEIAVLVARQPALYCQKLCAALVAEGIPFREEESGQDLASEPASRLILDFLLVIAGSRQPQAYRRLLDLVLFNRGLSEEREHQQRSRWGRFVNAKRTAFQRGELDLSQRADLDAVVREVIETIGRPAALALSPEYGQGQRFDQIVEETLARLAQQIAGAADVVSAIEAFGGDNAVRVMTVHKSKGLEFDTVVVLGVENQTFWAKPADERSVFFVGISRAKRRLILTVCDHRATPTGARRWDCARSEHQEFIGYCPN